MEILSTPSTVGWVERSETHRLWFSGKGRRTPAFPPFPSGREGYPSNSCHRKQWQRSASGHQHGSRLGAMAQTRRRRSSRVDDPSAQVGCYGTAYSITALVRLSGMTLAGERQFVYVCPSTA